MDKKKFKKRVFRDIHYKNLNLNQKIISIFLILLAIGVVTNIFPGDGITGGAITDDLLSLLSGTNKIITAVFSKFFGEENPLILYTRFILFIFVVSIVYFGVNLFTNNGFISLLAGIGIAFLSTFFIPMEAIASSGILYSGTFLIFLLLGPALALSFLVGKIEKSRRGYTIKAVILFVFLIFVQSLEKLETGNLATAYNTIKSVVKIGALLWIGYAILKAITIKAKESESAKAISALKTRTDTKIAEWVSKINK